jgi:rod shape-determining protein MreC
LSSEVTLITDKSLAIPIQIERNGLRAIAFGHGRDNTLDLPYLPANVDIQRGDKLITSGIDGVYPAGLAVATVSQIQVTPDSPFARIVCVPTGGVENHRQVLLVSIPNVEKLPEIEITTPIKSETQTKPHDIKQPLTKSATGKKPTKAAEKPQTNNSNKPHVAE